MNGSIGYIVHYALRTVLSSKDINIWSLFVKACKLLLKRSIKMQEAEQAHDLLKGFCLQFKNRYGQESYVLNMHLVLHLKECIRNYGSIYGYWCFGFERFNVLLGNYHTNNSTIEIQVIRKFCMSSYL